MSEDMHSVAIVADQPLPRAGFEKLVADDARFAPPATAASVDELLSFGGSYDVVMLDLPAAGDDPADVVRRAGSAGAPLVCDGWAKPAQLLAAVRAGAHGCVTRYTDHVAIGTALWVVATGGFYLCRRLVEPFQEALAALADEPPSLLAPREIETLRLIAMGYTHAQIATRMGLSPATVNTYAQRIRGKLNVSNKAELTRMAIELGHLRPSR